MRLRARRSAPAPLLVLLLSLPLAFGSISSQALAAASLADAPAVRAAGVSGPVIGVVPLGLDFGVVNIGEQVGRQYTIQNVGDEDLEIVTIVVSDPQITTDAPLPLVIHPGGSLPATATYAPTGGGLVATLEFQSNAANGAFKINAAGRGNSGPVLGSIGDLSAIAFTELRFTVTATDLDFDPVLLSVQGLPPGATFDDGTGEFAWTPGLADEGVHAVTFVATDGFASDAKTVAITVAVLIHPPVLEPPIDMAVIALGTTDQALTATDLDGNPLTFSKVSGPSYVTVTTANPGSSSAIGKVHLEPDILEAVTAAVTIRVSDGTLSDQKSFNVSIVSSAAGGSFGAATGYGTGNGLGSSVAIGDLNGDGWLDLAKTNLISNTVSVLPGNGDGSFGGATDYGTGITPGQVAVGDLNGDGWLDLVVVNIQSNTVSVLLGNGGGGFGDKTDYGVGVTPTGLVVEDLNGDGPLDLAVANANSHTVSVLLGHGDGTFGTKADYGTEISPGPVAAGDLNGDGRLDLAVASPESSTVSVLLGDGSGSFGVKTRYGTGSHPTSVAIGDLNGDHRLDLAVANISSGSVSAFLNQGGGSFGAKTDYFTGCESGSVAIGDLNGDGRLDLAVKNGCSGTVSIVWGNGDGSFGGRTDYEVGGSSVAIRDLNGDRRLDLVTGGSLSAVSVLLNQASAPGAPHCGPTRAHRVLVDASRDGGTWWSPQGGPYDPCAGHQGMGIADFLRSTGLEVDELPRPFAITRSLLESYDFVIRFAGYGGYAPSEVEAYREFVSNGGRLILVSHFQRPGDLDALADAFGISFQGIARGNDTVTRFIPHPITQGLSTVPYSFGSGILGIPAGATILGWLPDDTYIDLNFSTVQDPEEPTGAPAMGFMTLGSGKVFFIGSVYSFLGVPQPFLSNLVRFFLVRPVSLDVDPDVINLKSQGRWITAFIEPAEFDAAEIDPSSVRLEGIAPVGEKAAVVTDHDRDGLPDLELKFSLGALAPLLSVGNQTLHISGSILTGGEFEGSDSVRVIDPAGTHPAATVAPNPLNPAGVLTFSTTRSGPVSIKVFDLQGRLVRTLIVAQPFAAGAHEVLIDGRGERGQPLSSGVYFYRVEAPDGNMMGRLAILK